MEQSSSKEKFDDSLKFFKSINTKQSINKTNSTSSTSEIVSTFLNHPSTSTSSTKEMSKNRSKRNVKTKGKKSSKSQQDIRKMLDKEDKLIHHVITESCFEDNIDPYEMQLALALSESLKDQQRKSSEKDAELPDSKFENPFSTTGKVQSVNTVLERFGFKTRKIYTEYELDMVLNNKYSKRSKFQKFPTQLTRTTIEKRNELIKARYDKILALDISQCSNEVSTSASKLEYELYSDYLQSIHNRFNSVFDINQSKNSSDDELHKYYVQIEGLENIFAPSFTKADHLLKNWSNIPGRDQSPEREVTNNKENSSPNYIATTIFEEIQSNCNENSEKSQIEDFHVNNSSCSDIFENLESFEIDVDKNETIGRKSLSCVLESNHSHSIPNSSFPMCKEDLSVKNEDSILIDSDDSSKTIEYGEPFISSNNLINHSTTEKEKANEKEYCQISLLSSDEENIDPKHSCLKAQIGNDIFEVIKNDTDDEENDTSLSQHSDEDMIINISDEEINYSLLAYHNHNRSLKNVSNEKLCDDINDNNSTQNDSPNEIIEIDNLAQSWNEDKIENEEYIGIDKNVTEILDAFVSIENSNASKYQNDEAGDKSLGADGFSNSIYSIMRKYGVSNNDQSTETLQKMQSKSDLNHQNSLTISDNDVVDLTQSNIDEIQEDEKYEEENSIHFNMTINQSLDNILNSPVVAKIKKSRKSSMRKSLGIQIDEKYLVKTENFVSEPEYRNMTPVELKKELFKYGIRPLPVKRAIEILEYIYDQIHPKIRVAADEEIDINDSKREMNITDIITDICIKGVDDNFVFQLNSEIVIDDYILPKMKKSKVNY